MRTYLLKLAAFGALQLLLAASICWLADPIFEPNRLDASTEVRLRRSLGEAIFLEWLCDANVIRQTANDGPNCPALNRAFELCQSVDDSYLASIIDKDRRLRTTPGRRLILLGGSNLAFGVDSEFLAQRYDVTPVNLGIHEMLRAGYLLRHTEEHVRSGDVVIFCFEYGTMLSGAAPADAQLREQLCKLLPTMREHFADAAPTCEQVDWKEYSDKFALCDFAARTQELAWQFPRQLWRMRGRLAVHGFASTDELRRRFDVEFASFEPQLVDAYCRWVRDDTVYVRSGFNHCGDFIGHYGLNSERVIEPFGATGVTAEQGKDLEKSIAELNRFIAQYRARGAEVYFAYAPLCEGSEEFARQFEAALVSNLDAEVLFPVSQACTRTAEHYDSSYHLRREGVRRRMQIWTAALDRHLPRHVADTPIENVARHDRTMRKTILRTEFLAPIQP